MLTKGLSVDDTRDSPAYVFGREVDSPSECDLGTAVGECQWDTAPYFQDELCNGNMIKIQNV